MVRLPQPNWLIKTLTLVFLIFLFSSPLSASPVFAQNKMGVNIGTQLDLFNQAAEVVGEGGWVVVIICPGDTTQLASLISSHPEVNIVIRGHYPGQQLNREWALTWTATLGNLSTPNQIYFMPWNEPNQTGSHDWGNPSEVVSYAHHLANFLDEAGLRETKVKFLSPMINQSHPNFSEYVQDLKDIDPNFFSLFDGIAMNLYDVPDNDCSPGEVLCSNSPYYNPALFNQILAEIGATGKPVFGVESGTSAGNWYFDSPPTTGSPLYKFLDGFKNTGATMFALPAYDLGGEVGHSWNLFSPRDTVNLMAAIGQQQGPCCREPASSSWNQSFINDHNLVECPGSLAIGPNEDFCSSCAAPLQPRLSCPTAATNDTDSRPNVCEPCFNEVPTYPFCAQAPTISKTVSYPNTGSPNVPVVLNGTFSMDLSSLEIPFVGKKGQENETKYLADYFEGTSFNYRSNQNSNNSQSEMLKHSGVFQKLAPLETQNELKREMVRRASGYASPPVHDYLVTGPDGETARLTEFLNNLKPKNFQEQEKWKEKDGGKWYRLWPYVPMFTREDSPGQITLSVEQPGTLTNPGPFQIQVPHVARLYEVTKALSEMLVPNLSQNSSTQANTQPSSPSRFPPTRNFFNNPSSARNTASSTNLLTNSDFEDGFSERGSGEINVANGWEPWYHPHEGEAGFYHRPEYKPEDGEAYTDPLRVCRNRFGQKFFTTFSTHEAGFFQQVSVSNGDQVTFSIWGLSWSSGQDDPYSCAESGNYQLSVGIDPSGGTNPYSPNIVWSSPSSACNTPTMLTATTTAQDSTVTVFTKGGSEWPVKHNDSYLDNACLIVGGSANLPSECSSCEATGGGTVPGCEYPEATTGEGDFICLNGNSSGGTISTQITATDLINQTPKTPEEIAQCVADCISDGGDPNQCQQDCAFSSYIVSRKIGINVNHPYLYQAWQQTTEAANGLFNLFRPSNPDLGPPPDDETPAYGTVGYSFSGGSIDKESAQFYFPFLESIRKIKDWVSREALAPPESS